MHSISMSLKNENVSKASSYFVPDLLPKTHTGCYGTLQPRISQHCVLLGDNNRQNPSRRHSQYLLKSWITEDDQILEWGKTSGIILYDFLLMMMSTLPKQITSWISSQVPNKRNPCQKKSWKSAGLIWVSNFSNWSLEEEGCINPSRSNRDYIVLE